MAIKGISYLVDTLIVTQDELSEQAQQSAQAYQTTLSEIDDLQTELDSTKSRIAELQNQGPLTLIEQQELSDLQLANTQLERQLELKKALAAEENKEAAQDAAEALTKKSVYVNDASYNGIDINAPDYKAHTGTLAIDRIEAAQYYMRMVDKLEEQINDIESGILNEPEFISLSQLKDSLESYKSELTNIMNELQEDSSHLLENPQGYEDLVQRYNNLVDLYIGWSEGANALASQKVSELFSKDEFKELKDELVDLSKKGKLSVEKIRKEFPDLAKACDNAGLSVDDLSQELYAIASDLPSELSASIPTIDSISQSASNVGNAITSLNTALSEQNSSGSISSETYEALIAANSDYAQVIEYTATGIQLNADKAKLLTKANIELASSQIKAAKANDIAQYKENSEAIEQYTEALEDASTAGERESIQTRIDTLQSENTAIEANIQQYDQLSASLRALTSTYNTWIQAKSTANEGDMYDNIFSGINETKELYEQGLVGTDDFRSFVDLMTYQDMSTASAGELVQAYEDARNNFSLFFTEGALGCQNFLNRVHELNDEWAHINDNGEWEIDFGKGGDEDVAKALGISVDAVQAVLKKLRDYGFEVNLDFDDEGQSLDELVSKMEAGASASEILQTAINNIDSSSISTEGWKNLTSEIQKAMDAEHAYQNQQLEEKYQDSNINLDEIQGNINKFLEAQHTLYEAQNTLSPNIMDTTDAQEALLIVQETQEYLNSLPEEIREQLNIEPNEWAERIMNGEKFDVDINASTAISDLDALKIAAQQAYSVMMEDPTAENIANFQNYESLLSSLPQAIQTSMYLDVSQPENAFTDFQQMAADYQASVALISDANAGVSVDTSQLDNAYQVLENISSVMNNLPANLKTQLNIEGLSQEEILAKLQSNEITIPAELQTPDTSLAKAEVDSFVVYAESQYPVINIDADLSSAKQTLAAWDLGSKTITVYENHVTTGSSGISSKTAKGALPRVNGTAHAQGAVGHAMRMDNLRYNHPDIYKAYYGGDWGIPYDQTALVGELGPELLVFNKMPLYLVTSGGTLSNCWN